VKDARPIGRVLRRRYQKYIEALRDTGADEELIERCVRSVYRYDSAIARGRCPECGRALVRYGAAETARVRATVGFPPRSNLGIGGWVMYRCSSQKPPGEYDPDRPCDFALDRFEAGEAN